MRPAHVFAAAGLETRLDELLRERTRASDALFDSAGEPIARVCLRMAERFARGGRLLAVGCSPAARSDVRHVAVEFVHPVIVGKRALPAIGLTGDGSPLADQVELLAREDDVVMGFGADEPGGEEVAAAIEAARARGCLTLAFAPSGAEWELVPASGDPFVRQELAETAYHVLWELVHVFFEHRGLLGGRSPGRRHDGGASSFLYPFLAESERDADSVVLDVARSAERKARDARDLRVRTVEGSREELVAAARALRASFDGGGMLLAFGNGGSATDSADLVADLRTPPHLWPRRPALDLAEDPAILSALANDVGVEVLFARQVIAHGRAGDVALALSTSGGSANVLAALAEARRRSMATIALVGYDGGRVAAEGLADHVIVTPSEHIPRIQEAQATAYHLLRELVELV